MRRCLVVVLVLVAAACGDEAPADDSAGPTRATDPIATTTTSVPGPSPSAPPPASTEAVAGVVPTGFGTIAGRVTASDGEVCDVCLWLADDSSTRGRGLMQVTDLGGFDGMAFRYDSPHTTSFTMRNTVMPLSIAFFGADGVLLDAFDMEPCAAEPCPSYPTPPDFLVAIEVPQGGLPDLDVRTGSVLELLGEGCPAAS